MKDTLLSVLKSKDEKRFLAYLRRIQGYGSAITTEDLSKFMTEAPESWKRRFVKLYYPNHLVERVMMVHSSLETLKVYYHMWHFRPKNLCWAMRSARLDIAENVVRCLEGRQDSEVEEAMLERGDAALFMLWIEKFGELGEDAERRINEENQFSYLKNLYIQLTVDKE